MAYATPYLPAVRLVHAKTSPTDVSCLAGGRCQKDQNTGTRNTAMMKNQIIIGRPNFQ